jgi:hypothetical protein
VIKKPLFFQLDTILFAKELLTAVLTKRGARYIQVSIALVPFSKIQFLLFYTKVQLADVHGRRG